jgi:hypothetical protein
VVRPIAEDDDEFSVCENGDIAEQRMHAQDNKKTPINMIE